MGTRSLFTMEERVLNSFTFMVALLASCVLTANEVLGLSVTMKEVVFSGIILSITSQILNRVFRKYHLAFACFLLLQSIGVTTHYIAIQGIYGLFPLLIICFHVFNIHLLKPHQQIPYILISAVFVITLFKFGEQLQLFLELPEINLSEKTRYAQFVAANVLCLIGLIFFKKQIYFSRKKLDRNLKDQEQLIEAIETDFYILKANRAFNLTYASQSFMNEFSNWSAQEVRIFLQKIIHRKEENFRQEVSYTYLQKKRYFRVHQRYYPNEEENNYQLILQDITESKDNEKQLNLALRKELELNKMKNEFITMVSHQFRTPLTTIQSANQLIQYKMEEVVPEEDSPRMTSKFNQVFESVESLTGMMERLLDYGKMEANEINPTFQEIELESIIQKQINRTSPERVNFSVTGESKRVSADPYFMEHIVINLLTNALKYSEKQVRIQLQYTGETYALSVKDQGIGIAQKELSRLFTPFFRAQNTENFKGTGIGLSFVKKFVELHGGTVEVDSVPGQGACFKIHMPVQPTLKAIPSE